MNRPLVPPPAARAVAAALACAAAAVAAPAPARAADPAEPLRVDLRFVPQEATKSFAPDLSEAMRRQPVRIEFRDGRDGDDPSTFGRGGTDDDRPFDMRSVSELAPFFEKALRQSIASWGLTIDQGSDLVLEGTLKKLWVRERNKAVGSVYEAEFRAAFELREAGGRVRWKGKAAGEATRYGRKRSADNVSEVVSDASKRAFGSLLDTASLQASWTGEGRADGTDAVLSAGASAPDALLDELLELKDRGLGTTVLVNFLRGKTLSRALSAADLVRWERSGLDPAVIDAARKLPVAS